MQVRISRHRTADAVLIGSGQAAGIDRLVEDVAKHGAERAREDEGSPGRSMELRMSNGPSVVSR
jgi:hypothetical protein